MADSDAQTAVIEIDYGDDLIADEDKVRNAEEYDDLQERPSPESQKKHTKLCCGDLRVILNYMVAEQEKKKSGMHIGIFTVFLVVAVITMLDAVVSVTPVIFVKIGQETSGAIDFQLKYAGNPITDGNVNYYAIDPFESMYNNDYVSLPDYDMDWYEAVWENGTSVNVTDEWFAANTNLSNSSVSSHALGSSMRLRKDPFIDPDNVHPSDHIVTERIYDDNNCPGYSVESTNGGGT